jgi:hypothetical protein
MIARPVHRDPRLVARVLRRMSLTYRAGADPALDRPAYVRAASAMAWVGGRLVIVQDDANFLAIADPDSASAAPARSLATADVTLPAGPAGRRQFDDGRGNKAHKLDLESCVVIPDRRGATLLAFGSGSTPERERIIVADHWGAPAPRITLIHARELYAALRASLDFAGTELNIEGAALIGERELRLFGRGNGAARDGRHPVNASCALDWPLLRSYLDDRTMPPPLPRSTTRYELGAIEGVPLGFTDAMTWGDGILFSAAAEASPDAVRDGPVAGSVIGVIPERGEPRCTVIVDEHGAVFTGKVEGVASRPDARTIYAVADEDDPARPSELCIIGLEGF